MRAHGLRTTQAGTRFLTILPRGQRKPGAAPTQKATVTVHAAVGSLSYWTTAGRSRLRRALPATSPLAPPSNTIRPTTNFRSTSSNRYTFSITSFPLRADGTRELASHFRVRPSTDLPGGHQSLRPKLHSGHSRGRRYARLRPNPDLRGASLGGGDFL